MNERSGRLRRELSAEQAVRLIQNESKVFLHGGQMTPTVLVDALTRTTNTRVEMIHLHVEDHSYTHHPNFIYNNIFVGENTRTSLSSGFGSYIPVGLSQVPRLFTDRVIPLDVALVSVSPPDKWGYCTLGISVDIAYAAVQSAKFVIAQINKHVPTTYSPKISIDNFDCIVYCDVPLSSRPSSCPTDQQEMIGAHIAQEIEDNSIIQLGIGNISSVVASNLKNHRNINVHSEMISDVVVPLVERGVIERCKASFGVGSEILFNYVDNNPAVEFRPLDEINNFSAISSYDNFCAINSIIEADVTGNTVCDTIGTRHYSGVGGQHDFAHAALYSRGGKSFLITNARTKDGKNKIVPRITHGAGSPVPRHIVDYIVTEFGAVRLKGLNIHQRIRKMISIAHPDDREQLASDANELYQTSGNVFFMGN